MEICENLSLENIDGEIWKEICRYDDKYFVSNKGRVKSFKKCRGISERILKQNKDSTGYFVVGLCKNKKQKSKKIHILMYEAFFNYKLKEDECIHHKDFTKYNYLHNFKLMTKSEHTILHHKGKIISEEHKKLMSEKKKGENNPNYGKTTSEETKKLMRENSPHIKGENHPQSVLTEQDVIQIKMLYKLGFSTKYISEHFPQISKSGIKNIKNNYTWKHIKI